LSVQRKIDGEAAQSGAARKRRLVKVLGPGLIAGASDDDPSGIATYSQAGAQLGFSISWLMLLCLPLMVAIQEISGRIGRTTGKGIAANIRIHYSNWILQGIVLLLLAANTINIGADLGAMGDALGLLIGGPRLIYVLALAAFCAALEIWVPYKSYAAVLRWLTLALLSYFGTVLVVKIPWGEVARGLFVPHLGSDAAFWTTVVAILGTTISPYVFFWQASQEVEDIRDIAARKPLIKAPEQGAAELERIRLDTYIGMGLSNLVALAIIITTAATLHVAGVTDIETSTQAAEALRPVAGPFAFTVFTLGILGTGLLAVPVLAGSAAYGLAEARRWRNGLGRRPQSAKAFYATIALATLLGALINFSPIDPIKALYWSAVVNGVVAVPVMAIMMIMTANRNIMGEFVVAGPLRIVGWLATAIMAAAVVGMGITVFI
jgi:NRAMP (natural resistance-associated macrophage protein)-like metal ion transporter